MADTPDTEKPKLKPANKNPWYCLMTLHGEQPEGAKIFEFDEDLHAKNRRDWNKWAARALSEEQRVTLLAMRFRDGKPFFTVNELTPHNEKEAEDVANAFRVRTGSAGSIPIPTLNEAIDLSNTGFARFAALSNFVFPISVYLNGATFLDCVDLSGASFSGTADLTGATFLGHAFLAGVIFSGDAYFLGTKFSRDHSATFSKVKFHAEADFQNAELECPTTFVRAKFAKHPPSLHGAKLNEGTAFDEVTWPAPPPAPIKPAETGDTVKDWEAQRAWEIARNAIENDIKSYQRLKQMMETLKKHEDELEFFAREMACKRVLLKTNGENGKAWLLDMYDKLSDYGRSVARPTIALAWTMGITTFMIWIWMSWDTPNAHSLPKFKNALGLSLANLLAPLNFRKDFFDAKFIADLPDLIKLISGIQTLSGLLFTFLIGLGLRNRFRMK